MYYRSCTFFAVAAVLVAGCVVVQEKPADSAPPAPASAEPAAPAAEPAPAEPAAEPAAEPERPKVRTIGGGSDAAPEGGEAAETEAPEQPADGG